LLIPEPTRPDFCNQELKILVQKIEVCQPVCGIEGFVTTQPICCSIPPLAYHGFIPQPPPPAKTVCPHFSKLCPADASLLKTFPVIDLLCIQYYTELLSTVKSVKKGAQKKIVNKKKTSG